MFQFHPVLKTRAFWQALFLYACAIFFFSPVARADILTEAQIPDPALRTALESLTDENPLTSEACANLSGLADLSDLGIRDASGLQYLSGAETIDLSDNEITHFDQSFLSGMPKTLILTGNDGMALLKDGAFSGCESLRAVYLPQGMRTIGSHAFFEAKNLEQVNAPGVTGIGEFAFYTCKDLRTVIFPSLHSVGSTAFAQCGNLVQAAMPQANTLGESAFAMCRSLESFASDARVIGTACFEGCDALRGVNFPVLETIGASAFAQCGALRLFETAYPISIQTVGRNAFDGVYKPMSMRFIQHDLDIPLEKTISIPQALQDAAGTPAWALATVSDSGRMLWNHDGQRLFMESTNTLYYANLYVPGGGNTRYEFYFEILPYGGATRLDPLPRVDVPPTGEASPRLLLFPFILISSAWLIYAPMQLSRHKL